MKQKNILLIAVAVACGLVAAVLTSTMSGKQTKSEMVELMVAMKDIPVGTRITKDNVNEFIANKKFPKDAVPPEVLEKQDELLDKYITRMKLKDEPFNKVDVTTSMSLSPPPGMTLFPIRSTNDTTSPFIHPGSKVDLLCTIKIKGSADRAVVFPILTDMLILAINTDTTLNADNKGYTGNQVVSLATNSTQSILLKAAIDRGASIMLLPQGTEKIKNWKVPSEAEIWSYLSDEPNRSLAKTDEPKTEDKTPKCQLLVATKYLETGTQLTQEVIDANFKKIDVIPPAPTNCVPDMKEYVGKYLTKAIDENQFIPKSFIGEKPAEGPKYAREGMNDSSSPKTTVDEIPLKKPDPVKKVRFVSTVQTKDGMKKYIYDWNPKTGEYVFAGEEKTENQGGSMDDDKKPDEKKDDKKEVN